MRSLIDILNRVHSIRTVEYVSLLFGLIIVAVVLDAVLEGGYVGDDVYNSQIPYLLEHDDISLWNYVWDASSHFMSELARFFPGTLWLTALPYVLAGDVAAYKWMQVISVLIGASLMWQLLRQYVGVSVASASVVVLAATLEIRTNYDGLAGFSLQMQAVIMLLLGTLLLVARYCSTGSKLTLVCLFIVWSIGLLTYEMVLMSSPLMVIAVFANSAPKRRRIAALLVGIIPAIAYASVVAALRIRGANTQITELTSNFSPKPFLRTAVWQSIDALPMTFATFGREYEATLTAPWNVSALVTLSNVVLFVVVAGGLIALGRFSTMSWNKRSFLVASSVGLWLWIVPSLVVGQVVRWQVEHRAGLGYIPVFLEHFGVAILTAMALMWMGRLAFHSNSGTMVCRVAGVALAIGSLSVAYATVVVNSNNDVAIERLNQIYYYKRYSVDMAAKRGLFDGTGKNDVVRAGTGTVTENSCAMSALAGRKLTVVRNLDQPMTPYSTCNGDVSRLRSSRRTIWVNSMVRESGWVALLHHDVLLESTKSTDDFAFDSLRLYAWKPKGGGSRFRLTCPLVKSGKPQSMKYLYPEVSDVRSGANWIVASIRIDEGKCMIHGFDVSLIE